MAEGCWGRNTWGSFRAGNYKGRQLVLPWWLTAFHLDRQGFSWQDPLLQLEARDAFADHQDQRRNTARQLFSCSVPFFAINGTATSGDTMCYPGGIHSRSVEGIQHPFLKSKYTGSVTEVAQTGGQVCRKGLWILCCTNRDWLFTTLPATWYPTPDSMKWWEGCWHPRHFEHVPRGYLHAGWAGSASSFHPRDTSCVLPLWLSVCPAYLRQGLVHWGMETLRRVGGLQWKSSKTCWPIVSTQSSQALGGEQFSLVNWEIYCNDYTILELFVDLGRLLIFLCHFEAMELPTNAPVTSFLSCTGFCTARPLGNNVLQAVYPREMWNPIIEKGSRVEDKPLQDADMAWYSWTKKL